MPERKPPGMSWESFADEQIRAAQAAGEFDHLPGLGKPIPGDDIPHDENWWLREKIKRERLSVLPPALEIARDAADTLAGLVNLPSEAAVRRELTLLNERIRQANLAATWGPPTFTMPSDIEEELAKWRSRAGGS